MTSASSLTFAEAALLLDAHPPLLALADYCRLRAKGLRKPALKRAAEIAAVFARLPDTEQFRLLDIVLHYESRMEHNNLLVGDRDWMLSILDRWQAQHPDDARPLVWLGKNAPGDGESYMRRALVLDPGNYDARSWFINIHLCETHDLAGYVLFESILPGSEDGVAQNLEQAAYHIALLPDGIGKAYWETEWQDLSALFADWRQFKFEGGDDFFRWCTDRGRDYSRL